MSKDLQNSPSNEEVDLGQLFYYIERIFKKIGSLIVSLIKLIFLVLKKISIFGLFCITVLKKHFIKIAVSGIFVFIIFYILDKKSETIYQSSVIINQNYQTGRLLYNSVNRFNLLARNRDSISLSKELKINPHNASQIVGFDIKNINNNNKIAQNYHEFFKNVDSTLYISFDEFKHSYPIEDDKVQMIYVFTKDIVSVDGLAEALFETFQNNKYFKEHKEIQDKLLNDNLNTYEKILKKSDTLQKEYLQLLKSYYGNNTEGKNSGSTINLNLTDTKEKIDTREYDLLLEQRKIEMEVNDLKLQLSERRNIIDFLSSFSSPVKIENKYRTNRNAAVLITVVFVFFMFLLKELKFYTLFDENNLRQMLLKNEL